jgi:hypothetical protein
LPAPSEHDPLGVSGEQLHQWLLPLKAFREMHARLDQQDVLKEKEEHDA